jgi:enoyl-CoA hydratase
MGLIYEKRNSIAYITFNRPEARNAVDPDTVAELVEAWEDYRDDETLRCAILTGAGDKAFCAGADLGKLIPLFSGAKKAETPSEKRIQDDPTFATKAFLRGFDLFKPVIAAVNGLAIAGGMEILYGTDIRVASEEARFGLQEVKWSVFPAGGSSAWLPRQLPYARAMEILLTGELMDAEEALRLGFVNRVVPKDRVMEEAECYAELISKNGPVAVRGIKQSVLACAGLELKQALNRELEYALPVFMSEDAKEGPRAFKEKRPPRFKGK